LNHLHLLLSAVEIEYETNLHVCTENNYLHIVPSPDDKGKLKLCIAAFRMLGVASPVLPSNDKGVMHFLRMASYKDYNKTQCQSILAVQSKIN